MKAPFVLRDKLASIDKAADEAQRAAAANDSKQLFSIVRRLAGTPLKALSTLKDASGKVMATADEVLSCWRRHFEKLFKAAVVDDLQSRDNTWTRSPSDEVRADISDLLRATSFMPTIQQVFDVVVALKGDSGVGSDFVSAWLSKAGRLVNGPPRKSFAT